MKEMLESFNFHCSSLSDYSSSVLEDISFEILIGMQDLVDLYEKKIKLVVEFIDNCDLDTRKHLF